MATQVREYALKFEDDFHSVTSFFPGITYADYDRAGGISPWSVARMFEAGRAVPFYQGNFLDFNELRTKNYGFYVFGGDYYFDSSLWEVTRKYHYFPYKIKIELIDVGQSSLTIRQVLINSLDEKEVATYYGKLVYVDKVKQRSQELPYWFRKKYRSKESPERIRVDFSDYPIPSTAFKLKTSVTASDTDHNGHTNQGSYIRYCMDVAAAASKERVFKRLTHDICLYPILKMTTAYRNETVMGDEITSHVWQDDLSPQILYFTVHSGDKLVYTSTIKFKSTPSSKL